MIATVLIGGAFAAVGQTTDAVEPPLQYQLKVGDRTMPIAESVPLTVEGTFTDPSVTLVVAPERVFPYGGVRFSFPRHFTFEADFTSPDVKIWTVSGNSFKIMLFVSDQPLTAESLLDGMSEQLGDNASESARASTTLKLADRTLAGTRATVEIAIQKLTNDAFTLPEQGGKSRVLLLQDALKDNGAPSEEAGPATAMLTKSLVTEP